MRRLFCFGYVGCCKSSCLVLLCLRASFSHWTTSHAPSRSRSSSSPCSTCSCLGTRAVSGIDLKCIWLRLISWLVDMCFAVNMVPFWPIMRYGYGLNIGDSLFWRVCFTRTRSPTATFALQDYHSSVKSFAWTWSWFHWIYLVKCSQHNANTSNPLEEFALKNVELHDN